MAVFALGRSSQAAEGVLPFDPRHHLRGVAGLVSEVFGDDLDAVGRETLREMQMVSRLGPFLGGMLSMGLLGEFVYGFVWVERGQILGNVTLQRADFDGARWRISNVAVARAHRRRGIGRALLQAVLDEIADRGGGWAVLQVRIENQAAYRLYRQLGFSDVCRDGVWRLPVLPPRLPEVDPSAALRPLPAADWMPRLELAHASRSQLAHWAETINPASYEVGLGRLLGEVLGRLTGLYRIERWGAWDGERLLAAVETIAGSLHEYHRLRFAVRPEARGGLENAMVATGLHVLARAPAFPIIAEHSGDHAAGVAALEAAGFRAQRVLLTMRRNVEPAAGAV